MTSFIDNDGNELEYDGKDFAFTKQVISFYDFKIKSDRSVNVKFPNTRTNRKIFGLYDDNQLTKPTRTAVNIYRNGNKTDTGFLYFNSISQEEFECFFVTGNASWFNLWNFKCNEISTTRYDVYYDYNAAAGDGIPETFSRTEGIIFPLVDWSMRGDVHTNFLKDTFHVGDDSGVGGSTGEQIQTFVPCFYIHNLLKELATHAGTNIGGNLFEDRFFKTLIITPKDLKRWETPALKTQNIIVKPEHIMSDIKAVDFMKWVAISFGCIVSFDNDANSISLDIIDKMRKDEAEDWSAYYQSHETEYSKFFKNNYIRNTTSEEDYIDDYNNANTVPYGDLLVDSEKQDGSDNEVYKSPFRACYDRTGTARTKWATPVVDLWRLTDEQGYTFSSVTSVGGRAQFNGAGDYPWEVATGATGLVIRVDGGIYDGFHFRNAGGTDTNAEFLSSSTYLGTASGTFYTQSAESISGHRVLSCIPGVSPSVFFQFPTITINAFSPASTVATAYFSKKTTIYSTLNTYNQGLNYGEINEEGRNDISLQEKYLKVYSNILKNPPIKSMMLLPEQVFQKFNFGYVYIKSKNLTGYFLVESIENYSDPTKEVKVYLVKAD